LRSTPKVFRVTKTMHRALLASIILSASAIAAPNFSGEWKLNLSKSEYGQVPAPEFVTRSIKHSDPSLEISTHQKGAAGDVTSNLKYTTDGKEATNKTATGEVKGTAKWSGAKLVIDSTRTIQGFDIKSTETWALSEDGKTLTVQNHISLPQQGDFDVKQVFEKQ